MRAKKCNPLELLIIVTAVVMGILLLVGTAEIFTRPAVSRAATGGELQTAARESERRSAERVEPAPMATEGIHQEQERPQIEAAVFRTWEQSIQTAAPVARYYLEDAERDYIERVVMAEAEGEDFDGQCLVAQCILNTMEARNMSALDVVQERGQYAASAATASDSVKAAVAAVFLQGYRVTSEPVRYFYAPQYVYSAWHENSLVFVLEHGGHRFFKEG